MQLRTLRFSAAFRQDRPGCFPRPSPSHIFYDASGLDRIHFESVVVLILGPQVSRFRTAWARSAKGQEERFPPTRLSAGCGFRKETIVGMRRNGRDAPIQTVRPSPRNGEVRPRSDLRCGHQASGFIPSPLGPGEDHIHLPSAAMRTHKPLCQSRNGGVSAIARRHCHRIGLHLVAAIFAPYYQADLRGQRF